MWGKLRRCEFSERINSMILAIERRFAENKSHTKIKRLSVTIMGLGEYGFLYF